MSKLLALILLGSVLAAAAPITYTLNNPVGAGNISGSIETDGTIGVIGNANLLDWNLLLSDGSGTFNLLGPLSGNNSQVLVSGSDLSATATQLFFNFFGSGFALFQNPTIGSSINFFCIEATTACTSSPAGESLRLTAAPNQFAAFRETQVVASTDGGSITPEPATFGLMGLGAAVLALGRKKFASR